MTDRVTLYVPVEFQDDHRVEWVVTVLDVHEDLSADIVDIQAAPDVLDVLETKDRDLFLSTLETNALYMYNMTAFDQPLAMEGPHEPAAD